MAPRERRLLIIGVNYAPEATGIGPFTTGVAEHLGALGNRVTVISGIPHYPEWRARPAPPSSDAPGVTVLRCRHSVPHHQSAFARIRYEATFFATAARRVLGSERPDAVIGIVPMLADGVLARLAATRFRVPYGLLFQDLMGPAATQSGIAGGRRVARATATIERWIAAGAAANAIVSPRFAPYLRTAGVADERIVDVPNWPRTAAATGSRAAIRRELGWADGEFIVLHAGNMGLKQGLDQVVAAARAAEARRLPVRFVLAGDGNQRPDLERQAAGLSRLAFLGLQSDERHAAMLAAADALLLSERPSSLDMSLPSKLTSYLAAGRPVIGAVHPLGATAAELGRTGAAIVVPAADPGALLGAIDRLRADPHAAAVLGAAGRSYAERELGIARSMAAVDRFVDVLLGRTPVEQGVAA